MTNLMVVDSSSTAFHCTLAAPDAITTRYTGSFDCKVGVSIRTTSDKSDASTVVTIETGRENNREARSKAAFVEAFSVFVVLGDRLE